jgi:hypothetical protein
LVSGFSSSCNLSTHKPVEAITRRLLFAHWGGAHVPWALYS